MQTKTSSPIFWFTGLSGSGKSTLAEFLISIVQRQTKRIEYLDGDAMRAVFPSTGFNRKDRDLYLRHIGFLVSRLTCHGVTVVASFVSPYRDSREWIRSVCGHFIEIYISTPIEVCERRDVKGLYARARKGEILNFTGIHDPYEPPLRPEISIDTSQISLGESKQLLLLQLKKILQNEYDWTADRK